MGNQISKTKIQVQQDKLQNISKPSQIIDYIATHYILTMDFQNLKKLYDKDYCDKLVILTSDIIQKYFTDLDIEYIQERVIDGEKNYNSKKDQILFYNKDDQKKFDIKNSSKKKIICLNISKFYIKIAHLFASIVTTINPIFVYKDENGNIVRANLYEKNMIPKNAVIEIAELNICSNRINALKGLNKNNNIQTFNEDNIDKTITVSPKICDMNINNLGETKSLDEEPGISELYELYLDDNYNFETGKFTSMTENTKQIFLNDLKLFYKVFTGNDNMPDTVTKFSDIKLRNYHNLSQCQGSNPIFESKVIGSTSETNNLFIQYAENIRDMINKTNEGQEELLKILDQIFTYTIDNESNKKEIRINPQLSEKILQELIVKTRSLIIKLYLTCEIDYANGIKIYEAIVEKKILETAQSQIANLEKLSENLVIDEYK
jgi:hypothetical protein